MNNDKSHYTVKHPFKTMKRILSYVILKHKARFILLCLFTVITTISSVVSSVFVKILIDSYITPMLGQASPDYGPLTALILTMAAIFLLGLAAGYINRRITIIICQRSMRDIRDNMFGHMQVLPIRYFDTHSYGETMSRYTNDTDTLRQMIEEGVPQMISAFVTVISVFVAMVWLNLLLTVFVILTVILMLVITRGIARKSGSYFIQQQMDIGKLNGYIEEMMEGQKVIKVFCHEQKNQAGFDKLNTALCGSMTEANKFANILMPIMHNLGVMQYILLAVLGGAMAIYGVGGVTIGSIAAFLQLSQAFTTPITQISQQLSYVMVALAGSQRIFDLMDEQAETDSGFVTLVNVQNKNGTLTECKHHTGQWAWKRPKGEDYIYTPLAGDIRINHIDFGYTDDKMVLHDINIYAKPGQKVALVGATGAGKTTITNLLNRFYDIQNGEILYDGINISNIQKNDLRSSLGIVLQDTSLFTGTIRENIRYGNLDATDQQIIDAAKLAGAHDFIMMMPNNYDTILSGDGSGLSQGQRQLLAIARAAVNDPPVLILDEATSSIDTRTEAIVQRGMDSLMKGRTVFVIAHRLSTVKNSNVIMVMDHGRIIERGTHEDLIEQKGTYYQLYTGAFELS